MAVIPYVKQVMCSALQFILLFSGLWALPMCVTRQFYVVEQKKNWTDAQNYCRGNYTDLATIENQEDMDTILTLLSNQQKVIYWIGLTRNVDQNNNTIWVWSDRSNSTYKDWGTGQPDNQGRQENCVELYGSQSYKWNDDSCNMNYPFICYKKIPLILVQQEMTWWEALSYCRQNHVDLVSVLTNETQGWVETVSKNASTTNVWLGLRHTCTLDFWFWVGEECVCYQNWAPGNGTGESDCSNGERSGALQSGSKQWISLPETHKLNFICTVNTYISNRMNT
ncbi:macrophage mannose receptor 1-like isoform X2 [Brachyhypopomus gauderio]|uniref:macrophage mannose receptor 1-like isoform X2 n=1 Tax=Brachyhypopomus gauderio TaxID=698409 RepID=UPI0040429FB1